MNPAFFDNPLNRAVLLLAVGLLLVLLLVWLAYRAIRAAVRDGILDARQAQFPDNLSRENLSFGNWQPTERQTLEP